MSKITKILKARANEVLPNDRVKENIKQNFNINDNKNALTNTSEDKRKFNFKMLRPVGILALASIVLISIILPIATKNAPTTASFTYVTVDVNPSIEIVADENNNVVSVNPMNEDAAILLYGKKFTGSLEQVTLSIVETIEKGGYFANNNNLKLLTMDKDAKKEESVQNSLASNLNTFFKNNGIDCTVEGVSQATKAVAKEKNISPSKYTLIEEILSDASLDIDFDDLVEMDSHDLYKLARKYDQGKMSQIIKQLESMIIALPGGAEYIKEKAYFDLAINQIKTIYKSLNNGKNSVDVTAQINTFNKTFKEYEIKMSTNNKELKKQLKNLEDILDDKLDELEDAYEHQLDTIKDAYEKDDDKHDNDDEDDDFDFDDDLDDNDDDKLNGKSDKQDKNNK